MIAPNTISVSKVISKVKVPAKIENTKKASIVYINPIKSPLTSPNYLDFLKLINTPRKILIPFIT